jgi:hypothetical protein
MMWGMRMLRRRADPKTQDLTLCEPAQPKCTWTCHRSHLTREFTGKMLRRSWIPICASLRNRNGHGHITRGILCENSQGKCRAPDGSRDRDPHFVRACAVKTHVEMSQELSYVEICRGKCRAPDGSRDHDPHFMRACASEMHMDMSQEPFHAEIYR